MTFSLCRVAFMIFRVASNEIFRPHHARGHICFGFDRNGYFKGYLNSRPCVFDKLIGLMGLHRVGSLPSRYLATNYLPRRKMQVATLQGEQLSFEVFPTNTLKELKVMLVARKHREDPTERKLCRVKVLAGGALLVDDDQTLESAGLMRAGCDVMVIYTRSEVEAAKGEDIHEEDFLHVTIPSHITEIESFAFELCKNVLTVTIPESVTTIHDDAFIQCYNLTRITLPESLTIIGPGAFSQCKSLESVAVPESVEFIGSHAFAGCKSLKKITLGGSLTMISDVTFQYCCSLTGIAIPASVDFIGAAAFQDCNSLENISICGPLTRISRDTFKGCESLEHMVIPALVTVIGQGAFEDCCSLERVIMPESLTVIGNKAFKDCTRLMEITILRRVLTIGIGAFIGCTSLRSIYMHTSLGYDAEEAFDEDALAFITLFEDDSSGPSQTPFFEWRRKKYIHNAPPVWY